MHASSSGPDAPKAPPSPEQLAANKRAVEKNLYYFRLDNDGCVEWTDYALFQMKASTDTRDAVVQKVRERSKGEYGPFILDLLRNGGMTPLKVGTLPDSEFKEAFSMLGRRDAALEEQQAENFLQTIDFLQTMGPRPERVSEGPASAEAKNTLYQMLLRMGEQVRTTEVRRHWHPTMEAISGVLEQYIHGLNETERPGNAPLITNKELSGEEFGRITSRCSDKEVQALLYSRYLDVGSVLNSPTPEAFAERVAMARSTLFVERVAMARNPSFAAAENVRRAGQAGRGQGLG